MMMMMMDTVAHPSTNRARRNVTSLIETNVLPLRQAVMVLSVECQTRDQVVMGSSLGRARGVKTLGKFLTPMCLCHQAVQVGTGQRAVMPCGWGVKAGVVCVWVAGKTV